MPVVMKFGPSDWGTLCEQICDMQQIQVILAKKLVEGELWAEVTHVTIWGHMRVLPSMSQVI